MAKSPKRDKEDDSEGKKHKKEKKERRRAERTTAAEASTPQRPRPQQDDLFDMIERNWGRAWDTVNYNVKKEEEETAERQDKGRGKGKATTWTRNKPFTLDDFPWELRLAKRKTAAMTRNAPRKRRPEDEEDEMEQDF